MGRFQGVERFRHDREPCIGVLVTNLGTPDAPTASAVRRYLREFLWDPRIVEVPRAIWWMILNGPILTFRPKRSAHAYQQVWTEHGAPLLKLSEQLVDKLRETLAQRFDGPVKTVLGMRYGNPSIAAGLRELRDVGATRIVVLPLYPQYSATTTASTFDAISRELQTWRWLPEVRMVMHYHDNDAYINALAGTVKQFWQTHGRSQQLLMSFHSIPKSFFLNGDPYYCECQKTARLLAQRLDLQPNQWRVSFQSRLGRMEWLKPYTDETLQEMAKQGVPSVDVVCPGFAVDCLETLEEIAMTNRDLFLASGGSQYRYIPALNDSPDHITALADMVEQQALGWPGSRASARLQPVATTQELTQTLDRAKAMGATG